MNLHHFTAISQSKTRTIYFILTLLFSIFMASFPTQAKESQLNHIPSQYGFDETVEKLQSAFKNKGLTIFAVIDHAKAAQSVDIDMPATQVIIFGNPKAGTPLMLKAPDLAIQLPLKVLVSQRKDQVVASIFNAEYLATSVGQPKELTGKLNKVSQLIYKTIGSK